MFTFDVQCRLSRHQNEVQYIGQQGRNMTTAMTGVGQKVQTAFFGIAVLIRGLVSILVRIRIETQGKVFRFVKLCHCGDERGNHHDQDQQHEEKSVPWSVW